MTGPRFLRLRTVSNAVVVPRPDHTDRSAGAGVIRRSDQGWSRVSDTGVRRRGKQYVEPPPTTGVVEPVDRLDTAVFAGFVYAHFGHFLLESLGRLWFDQVDADVPIVWLPATTDRFDPWMTELADLTGVGSRRTVVHGSSGPVEVGELLIPDQGFEVQRYLHPWFTRRLAVRPAEPDPDGVRLWLSRSALGDLAGVEDEVRIEARLADRDWTVVHPEQYPIAQQVELLAGATSIAGIEGSAFHTLLLVSGYRGTVDLVTRHDSPNFELIARAAGWDQVRHQMHGGTSHEWHRPSGARDVRWTGVDVDRLVRSVDESSRRLTSRRLASRRLASRGGDRWIRWRGGRRRPEPRDVGGRHGVEERRGSGHERPTTAGAAPAFLQMSRARHAIAIARPDLDDWSGGAGVLRRVGPDLRYVRESGISRFGRSQIEAPEAPDRVPDVQLGSAVFAGYLYDHYGHFLLESLARLWAPALDPSVPLVWIAGWTTSFEPWMTEILDLIRAPGERLIVTAGGPMEVNEMAFPHPGFEFGSFMHPWLARRLAAHPADHEPTDHVWLSRSARVPNSGLDEELELEAALEATGWKILRPEQHTIGQQVDVLAGAVHVSGLEGSAFHTLALLNGFRGAVDLFTRQHHPNFEIVAHACRLDQVRHTLPGATARERPKTRGTDVQWSGVDIDATVQLLQQTCARHGHPTPG